MANILGDILLPAGAGIGAGFSQGIKDYANIKALREQEEMFPLQKGIVQSQLNKAKREEDDYRRQQEDLDREMDYKTLPQYLSANEENKKIFDRFMDGKPRTKRGVMMAFQEAQNTSTGFKAISDTGMDIHAGKVAEAQESYNKAVENFSRVKPTLTATMGQGVRGATGFEYENPELTTARKQVDIAEQNLRKLQSDHETLEKNVNRGKAKVAINEMYMANKELIDSNKSLKMMVDMTREIGDTQDVAKLIDIIAKAKDPKIANEVELFLSTHQGLPPKEIWNEWEKFQRDKKTTPTYHFSVSSGGKGGASNTVYKEYVNKAGEHVTQMKDKNYYKLDENGDWKKANKNDLIGIKEVGKESSKEKKEKQSLKLGEPEWKLYLNVS